jgi:hypothetical protein
MSAINPNAAASPHGIAKRSKHLDNRFIIRLFVGVDYHPNAAKNRIRFKIPAGRYDGAH